MSTGSNINNTAPLKKILVAPLDWGLGHTTRCLPLIKHLKANGVQVIMATEGAAATLLQQEFPEDEIVKLRGYRIRYSRLPFFLLFKLLAQLPSIILTYRNERRFIKKWVRENNISAVISDNRPGLFHAGVPTVYITHQLNINHRSGIVSKIISAIHRRMIEKFSDCWVPDFAGAENMAGDLSHPQEKLNIPVKYIGCLSRFEKQLSPAEIDILIVLSGPEPQRTILEKRIIEQIPSIEGKIVLIRGLPGKQETLETPDNLECHNHLPSIELNQLMASAKLIIARSGYSTVMDLVCLEKKAILIPTPGQGEQEYLAKHLSESRLFPVCEQNNFDLKQCLKKAEEFNYTSIRNSGWKKQIISDWLEDISRQ